ncbi:hydrolase 1, exosortase A system-associated [Diaphorobacter sp.]|uniref:hydrolase 1, exosortase A system-associated n=1 Tax=Diaphorobacter sp. TaxID=1934310 RepID=UPI003D0E93FE
MNTAQQTLQTPAVVERAVQIRGNDAGNDDGQGFDMLGILTLPAPGMAGRGVGVVVVVGGAQYRVGSHRQFVQLARRLAAAGYPVLRFDLPGMGDSPGAPVPFDRTAPHIAAAVDALLQSAAVGRTVLWGLCDGASASLLYMQATQDARVCGLALLNPWVRSEASLARTHVRHYYRQRLLDRDFWRKLAAGGIGWAALRGIWHNLRAMRQPAAQTSSFQERMAQGWQGLEGKIMLILSEHDLTAREFLEYAATHPDWRHALLHPGVRRHDIAGGDHTCSRPANQLQVQELTLAWLAGMEQAQPAPCPQPPDAGAGAGAGS